MEVFTEARGIKDTRNGTHSSADKLIERQEATVSPTHLIDAVPSFPSMTMQTKSVTSWERPIPRYLSTSS